MNTQETARRLLEAFEYEPGKLATLDQAAATFRDEGGDASEALTEALDVIERGEVEPFELELAADVAYVSALVLVGSAL